jgi:hypothetical protein
MVSSRQATLVRCCLLVGAMVAVVAAMWVISNLSAHAWATGEQPAIGRDCLHCGQPLRPRPVATSEIGHSRAGPIGCFSGPAHRHHRHQLSAISSSPPCGPVSGPAQRLHKARWAHSTGSTTALILCSPEPVHRRHHPGAASPWSSCGPVPDTAQQQPLAAIRRARLVSPPVVPVPAGRVTPGLVSPPVVPVPTPAGRITGVHGGPGVRNVAGARTPSPERPERLGHGVEQSRPTRADHAPGVSGCRLKDVHRLCPLKPVLGPVRTGPKHKASRWTELRHARCDMPVVVTIGARTSTWGDIGARGRSVESSPIERQPRAPSGHQPRPVPPLSSGEHPLLPPPTTPPGGTGQGSGGNAGGGDFSHLTPLAAITNAVVLTMPGKNCLTFSSSTVLRGLFVSSQLERPG